MDDDNDEAMGCCAASPVNIAPGEKGITEEEYLDEERRWLLVAADSADEPCWCEMVGLLSRLFSSQ
jgi:hypothetical protein